jgi:regulator of protease activity HflC (stomatin/prohibitin superfamily)
MRRAGIFGAILIGLAVLAIFNSGWFTVEQGDRGVVLRNGAFLRIAEPGLGLKIPLFDTVTDMSIRTQKDVFEKVPSYSKDIQLANLNIAVNYRLDVKHVKDVYEKYGTTYSDKILSPIVTGQSKIVFGRFSANDAIEQRGRLVQETEQAIRAATEGTGILIDGVQLQNIDFSPEFEKSIEARMQAEVEVLRLKQNLEREKVQADIARTQANGRADAVRAEAKAKADATRLQGEAEAAAITARAEALKQNVNLVELVKAEKWDGKLPTTMLPGTATPFINVK